MATGIELITAERQRQIEVEGWTPDLIRNLIKAGALIAAEIDRLQRAAQTDEIC